MPNDLLIPNLSSQLGSLQLGSWPLGGSRVPHTPVRVLIGLQVSVSVVGTHQIYGLTVTAPLQLSALARNDNPSVPADSRWGRAPWGRILWSAARVPKIARVGCNLILSTIVRGSPTIPGRVPCTLQVSASAVGTGIMVGIGTANLQVSARANPSGTFAVPVTCNLQMSATATGVGVRSTPVHCNLQISCLVIGPQTGAGIVAVVSPAPAPGPPPTLTGSYCN